MRTMSWSMLRSVLAWPVESQHQARRNALVASTALARQRHERLEVERFLDRAERRRTASGRATGPVAGAATGPAGGRRAAPA